MTTRIIMAPSPYRFHSHTRQLSTPTKYAPHFAGRIPFQPATVKTGIRSLWGWIRQASKRLTQHRPIQWLLQKGSAVLGHLKTVFQRPTPSQMG
jgi:hypothetical protein